jgi:DNA (cytosine-5)-methyltransferase 1
MRPDFAPYFDYVLAQAADPSIAPASSTELWQDHFARIKRHQASGGYRPEYHVRSRLVNAADFGVPQLRFRVFIVATRFELGPYNFPKPSHSRSALVRAQRTCGYWESRGACKPRQLPTAEFEFAEDDGLQPWVTVRDALSGLGPPSLCEDGCENNHWLIPGARSYHGHRGSSLDLPSKTIKAGVHGVPGGENCLVDAKGRFRYYTLREAARIQTFPDEHQFLGSRTSVTKQIGNAVPCELARAIARPLFTLLEASAPRAGQRDVARGTG